jgi:methionine aminopeptidase
MNSQFLTTLEEDAIQLTKSYEEQQDAQAAIESGKFAHQLLDEICEQLKPGVLESEIRAFAQACFDRHKVERTWHQSYVRFGAHTMMTYRDKTQEDFLLGDDDIAFIDIGVVKGGVEGDAGKTVVMGGNPEYTRLKNASEAIFTEARAWWQKHQCVGVALYEYIHELAVKMDVLFSLDPAGHLIGAFPHRGWKAGLNHYPQTVKPGTWILEIQVSDKARRVGAFYEDLLY